MLVNGVCKFVYIFNCKLIVYWYNYLKVYYDKGQTINKVLVNKYMYINVHVTNT